MIIANDALQIFPGGVILEEPNRVVCSDLECPSCGDRSRIIKAKWPDKALWQCHGCGREAVRIE